MILSSVERVVLNHLKKQLDSLPEGRAFPPEIIEPMRTYLNSLLQERNGKEEETDLLTLVNINFRTPIITLYENKDSEALFPILILLCKYFPLNSECLITLSEISDNNKMFLTSGHVMDIDANDDGKYQHPLGRGKEIENVERIFNQYNLKGKIELVDQENSRKELDRKAVRNSVMTVGSLVAMAVMGLTLPFPADITLRSLMIIGVIVGGVGVGYVIGEVAGKISRAIFDYNTVSLELDELCKNLDNICELLSQIDNELEAAHEDDFNFSQLAEANQVYEAEEARSNSPHKNESVNESVKNGKDEVKNSKAEVSNGDHVITISEPSDSEPSESIELSTINPSRSRWLDRLSMFNFKKTNKSELTNNPDLIEPLIDNNKSNNGPP